ncbi:MAG TPA: hypothetical protein VMS31_11225 [Pyrinomonadaceae bacterium]|nr:hypothetical protein [Pyrinomonadaceae bacterium]
MKKLTFSLAFVFALMLSAQGQSFSSGSTGADGALDLSTMSCPSNICQIQLPESGVLNYTTVSIPAGFTLNFKRNQHNTPVTLLAQGSVNISGVLDISASDGGKEPGPGGFYGGGPGGFNGFGPGGGTISYWPGKWIGPLSLMPLIGGSGGYTCGNFQQGGAGGGAIVIASSTSISVSGAIVANGGATFNGQACPGSGGSIRLVANSINVTNALSATSTGQGVIRLEAPSGFLTFAGTANPPAGLFPINPNVKSNTSPVLTIVSIAGFPVPSYAGSRFDTYDMLLPNQLSDPISVVVHGTNIPVGTQVTVGFVSGSPTATSTPGTLSGTFESSSATATISALNRGAVTYLLATAIFDPPMGAMRFNPRGPNQVAKIRVMTSPGGRTSTLFLRSNGTEVDRKNVSQRFLEKMGL